MFNTKISLLCPCRTQLSSKCNKVPRALCGHTESPGYTNCIYFTSCFSFCPPFSIYCRRDLCILYLVEIVNVSLIASIKPAQAYLTIVINWKCDYTQIEGTIVAPDDPKNWNFAKNGRIWLGFFNLTGALFQGGGVIDGSGSKWWAASCKKNKTNVTDTCTTYMFFYVLTDKDDCFILSCFFLFWILSR